MYLSNFLSFLKSAFNNPSFSAMLGAFFAYSLVVLTDWRRNKRKKKILFKLIAVNKEILKEKKEAINNILHTLEKKHQLIGGPLQYFSIDDIKKLQIEVLDLLTIEEKITLDTLCFHMEEIDTLAKNSAIKVEKLRNFEIKDKDEIAKIVISLKNDYLDIKENLNRLNDFMENFLKKDYKKIIEKKYKREIENTIKIWNLITT